MGTCFQVSWTLAGPSIARNAKTPLPSTLCGLVHLVTWGWGPRGSHFTSKRGGSQDLRGGRPGSRVLCPSDQP